MKEEKEVPITSTQFDEGKSTVKVPLGEVMVDGQGFTVPEVSELIGMSWGIAKKQLIAAEKDGFALQRKIGRSIYWRYYADGVPEDMRPEEEE